MSKNKSLGQTAVKAGMWYTIGNIALKGCAFLSLPIFTRLLSTSDFGIYNSYIAYEQILTAILGLGLYGTVKNAKIDFKDKFEQYLSSVLSLSIIFFVLVLLITNATYSLYANILGFSRFVTNILLLQSFGAYLLFFYGTKLNVEFKYKSFLLMSCINVIGNILISIFLILYVFPNERYLGRIIGSALPLIGISLFICLIVFRKSKVFVSSSFWKYALVIGLPLVPHVVSQSLLSQFDRIMIKDMVGADEAGIYGYVYTICSILYIVGNSIENAWTPWVFITLSEGGNKNIERASRDYVKIFSILTIGFMCVMPEITKLFAGKEYWSGINLIVPLTIGNYFVFLYTLPVNIEYYNKKTAYISVGTICAAALNIVLNYVGIKLLGYQAAAYTTFFSYLLLFVFHWIIAKKFQIDDVYDLKNIALNILFVSIGGMAVILSSSIYVLNLIIRIGITLILLVLLYRNRTLILNALRRKK